MLLEFQQQLYSSMQVQAPGNNQVILPASLSDQLEDYDKQQLSEVYKEIKQEMTRYKPESLTIFQDWVTKIYKLKIKIPELGLDGKNIQFSVSASDIQAIINKLLLETCEIHRQLIEQQLKCISEPGLVQGYFKVDADGSPVGYFDHLRYRQAIGEGTKSQVSLARPNFHLNEQYYAYCVWVIYNHYCSLAECNELVCQLAKLFHQTSENLFFRIFKEIQRKKAIGENVQESREEKSKNKNVGDSNQIRQIVSMVEDQQVVKLNELNILTILNLIPSSIPSILILEFEGQRDKNVLYGHICSFETTINTIIYDNKQSMRRFMVFLTNFKRALKVLKDRLGKKDRDATIEDYNLIQRKAQDLKYFKRQFNFSLFNDDPLTTEIQEKIDRERISDQIFISDEKSRLDQAQLVRNIDQLVEKEKSNKKSQAIAIRNKQIFSKMEEKGIKQSQYKQGIKKSFSESRKSNFTFRNSNFVQNSDNIESITRISAMLTQNNVESYKFEVIVKKNQKVVQSSGRSSLIKKEDQLNQSRKRLECRPSQSRMQRILRNGIVEDLKNNLNSLIKNQLPKEEEFANYLKITQKHDRGSKNYKFDAKLNPCDVNLHEFIQQNDFKNDEEQSEGDENYLQRMQSEHLQNQRKKKKKKNKKKKNQKQEAPQQVQIQKQANAQQNGEQKMKQMKSSLKNEVGPKEYEVILSLESTKIDQENRLKCFQIDEDYLLNMKKRQMEQLVRCSVVRKDESVGKVKGKSKKHKAK